MNKIIRVERCVGCSVRVATECETYDEAEEEAFEKGIDNFRFKILPGCPLDDEVYDLGPDLEKAVLLMKRLIKSNAREGWEDSEHYNTVLDDANDFLANFEEIDKSEEIGEIELN